MIFVFIVFEAPSLDGPLGYNGSKAAMQLIAKADVVLALGTRLNPFSTLPGYGIDYWPKKANVIQVDMNSDRIGLTKKVTVGICGDAKLVSQQLLSKLSKTAGDSDREKRKALIHQTKSAWLQTLTSLNHEEDDPGTTWNKDARERDKDKRPLMGKAANLADKIIITNDNPRNEDEEEIAKDILKGIELNKETSVILNRKEAYGKSC